MPVAGQLRVYGGDVLERIGLRRVDDVNEKARALDVTQELFAQAEAAARALDETGNVRDDELAIVQARDAEVWSERGERVVGDLRSRAGERREERRLPRVRKAGEPHVGEE